jgi:Ca2+-binding EF-hand superfamily protein
MKRFDINGDCRIELDDFIIIMNFANNDYLNKFNYSNNNNFELFTRDNYNINQRNDFNFENNHHKDFYSFCYSDNRNQFYNIKKNENVYLPILNLRQERIKKCNSMEDILSNKNIKEFGFTRDKKNILDNYINQNDFRKSKLSRHNSLEIPMEKRKKYINNLNISQTEISNKTPLRNYTRNNIVNFKNKTQENQDINQLSSRTKKIIFQGFNNINSINNMNNNNNFQNENIKNKYNSNLNKLSSIYKLPYNKQQKKIDMSILITGYIKVVISMEFEIEQKKIKLNKREDFSIKGLYNLFESQTHINKITISSFNRVLTLFGKELTSRELFLLFKRFDIGQKGYLVYEDFFNIFIPFEKRIRDSVILNYIVPKEISKKTLIKMIEIIECIIEFEIQLEKMRYEMNASENDIIDYFHLIDKKNNGFIYYDDIQFFLLNYLEDNIENRIGIDLFFLRLDKKRNDKIIFKELYDELKH